MEGGGLRDQALERRGDGLGPAGDRHDVDLLQGDSGSFAYSDDDKTPVNSDTVRFAAEEQERRGELARSITQFLSRLPDTLSLPTSYELAKLPDGELFKYEEMYRFLYETLQEILVKYIPSLHMPSFDQLMEDGPRGGKLGGSLRELLRKDGVYFLGPRLFFEVGNHLSLFAAFASHLGNARYIRAHKMEDL